MTDLALYNFEPRFCPKCGISSVQTRDRQSGFSFRLRSSFACSCGLRFQKVRTEDLVAASRSSEGDLFEKLDLLDHLERRPFPVVGAPSSIRRT